jgi:hypothetical protein
MSYRCPVCDEEIIAGYGSQHVHRLPPSASSAPAASQAPGFEALVDALRAAVMRYATGPAHSLADEVESVGAACTALLAHHSAVVAERDALLGKIPATDRRRLYDAEAWDAAMDALGKEHGRVETAESSLAAAVKRAADVERKAAASRNQGRTIPDGAMAHKSAMDAFDLRQAAFAWEEQAIASRAEVERLTWALREIERIGADAPGAVSADIARAALSPSREGDGRKEEP